MTSSNELELNPRLLILNSMPYPLGHMLLYIYLSDSVSLCIGPLQGYGGGGEGVAGGR